MTVHHLVLRGALPGNVGLPGDVASLSRQLDAHHRGIWWDEAVPGVPQCLPISGWPSRGPCHVCAAMCCLISAAVPLRFLDGPLVGLVPFRCRWRLACSWGRLPGFGSRLFRAPGGSPDVTGGRCGGH